MTISEKLSALLLEKEQYIAVTEEDKKVLNKTLVSAQAREYNPELLALLQNDEEIKNHFFVQVNDIIVFKLENFLTFINNRSFLPDSFTEYKNKIGLATDKENYLANNRDVVLNWPYKDCILEGGQNKDDQKRNEVFFNEVLAPDQINRLLDDKVFVNWKRYKTITKTKQESGMLLPTETFEAEQTPCDELKPTDNLIIKGNNLVVLHSLKQRFAGKVKLIYIDPPYNTGSDSFKYNDNFNHSTWLTFMKNRLEVARELLKNDGVIFVHCDDSEQAYLKVLMDEIFGRNQYVETITVVNNPRGRDYGGVANMHEFMLVYSKDIFNYEMYRIEDDEKEFPFKDKIGGFEIRELRNRNTAFHVKNRPNLCYPFYVNPNNKIDNDFLEMSLEPKEGFIEVLPAKSQGIQTVWRWGKEKSLENLNINIVGKKMQEDNRYMIVEKYRDSTRLARSVWWDKEVNSERGTVHLRELFVDKVFNFPKPETLLSRILQISTKENDLVLDFHLGSGTTATVAHKMNRQYIGIEQMDYIESVSVERMKKVLAGEQGGISKSVSWQGGGEFVYCELANDAEDFRNEVRNAKGDELPALLEKAKQSSFLSYRVNREQFNDFETLNEDEQRQLLLQLVDTNTLYVNYSDIESADYEISKNDKELNRQFYEK